jgi:hypothetical protein
VRTIIKETISIQHLQEIAAAAAFCQRKKTSCDPLHATFSLRQNDQHNATALVEKKIYVVFRFQLLNTQIVGCSSTCTRNLDVTLGDTSRCLIDRHQLSDFVFCTASFSASSLFAHHSCLAPTLTHRSNLVTDFDLLTSRRNNRVKVRALQL